jgi:hypothetical protein
MKFNLIFFITHFTLTIIRETVMIKKQKKDNCLNQVEFFSLMKDIP